MNRKSVGFTGERIIEVPTEIVKKCRKMPLIGNLHITKMGLYPKARYHYFNRPRGIAEVILIHCTAGEGWIKVSDAKLILKTGGVYVIPSGTPHSYGSTLENPWTIYWLHLSGAACDEAVVAIMGKAHGSYTPVNAGVYPERLAVFESIERSLLKGYSINNLLYANLTLCYFLSSFILYDELKSEKKDTILMSQSEKAVAFMQKNLAEPANLTVIAKNVNASVSYFSRTFKKETGYSPVEYFNYLKIQRACQLIHLNNLRINEVALQVGIADPFYFSRLFKKQIGISPVKYRKNEQNVDYK